MWLNYTGFIETLAKKAKRKILNQWLKEVITNNHYELRTYVDCRTCAKNFK